MENSAFETWYEKFNNKYHQLEPNKFDLIISIENGIVTKKGKSTGIKNVCYVMLQDKNGNKLIKQSSGVSINPSWFNMSMTRTQKDYKFIDQGLSVTIGQLINEIYRDISTNNWMKDCMFGGNDGVDIISEVFSECLQDYKLSLFRSNF